MSRETANIRKRNKNAVPALVDEDDTKAERNHEVEDEPLEEVPYYQRKSNLVAYFLWMIGGIFGLHHFYLGRDSQAFLWCTSFGGYWIGVFRDVWRIPTYVSEANFEPSFVKYYTEQMNYRKRPPGIFTTVLVGQFLFAIIYRMVAANALPRFEEDALPGTELLLVLVGAFSSAWAVNFIGTMPFCYDASFGKTFIAALIGEFIEFANTERLEEDRGIDESKLSIQGVLCGIVFAMVAHSSTRKYKSVHDARRAHKNRPGVCKRAVKLWMMVVTFWALLGTGLYFNGEVESDNGSRTRVKESIDQIRNSPVWAQIKQNAWIKCTNGYTTIKEEGFSTWWQEVVGALDVDGRRRAYVDLELSEDATQEEIKASARKLQKKYHPDRCTEDKDVCIERFQAVQNAYEVLHDKASKKKEKNTRSKRRKPRG